MLGKESGPGLCRTHNLSKRHAMRVCTSIRKRIKRKWHATASSDLEQPLSSLDSDVVLPIRILLDGPARYHGKGQVE